MRKEVGFHENAIERIFLAIKNRCQPDKLCVTGRFMRRGGIDINPTRSFGYSKGEPQIATRVPGQ
jgi:7-cyano-7-deazaguanine reductase